MGQKQIAAKLTDLLGRGLGASDEPRVVYVMIELRKILEHESAEKWFPHLKFYADWAVHTRKDRISDEMRAILDDTYRVASDTILKGKTLDDPAKNPVLDFAKLTALRDELRNFLITQNIPSEITSSDAWDEFSRHLIQILEGQPMVTKDHEIEQIYFEHTGRTEIQCVVRFRRPVANLNEYAFRVEN